MKIAIIGNNPQNFFNPIAKELGRKGHIVDLIAFDSKGLQNIEGTYNTTVVGVRKFLSLRNLPFCIFQLLNPLFWKYFFKPNVSFKSKARLLVFLKYFPSLKDFDVINVQQVNLPIELLYIINARTKMVLSFWGSDIFRANQELKALQKPWVKRADAISLHHKEMEAVFKNRFPDCTAGVYKCLFPLDQSIFSYLDKTERTVSEKINVSIGYNINPDFKHLAIIELLAELDVQLKNRINILLFASYGGSEEYLRELKEALKKAELKNTIYTDKVSIEELAERRKNTDIMIHLPSSDAFSATVSEVLYAQNIVIAGDWLPYSLYKEHNVYMEEVGETNEVANKLKEVVQNYADLKEQTAANPQAILKTLDYNGNLHKWVSIFEELGN